jgi:adenosylhomocysteinase
MMAVNDAKTNTITTTSTAQARASGPIMHTTNLVVAGKTVVVAGFGCAAGAWLCVRGPRRERDRHRG